MRTFFYIIVFLLLSSPVYSAVIEAGCTGLIPDKKYSVFFNITNSSLQLSSITSSLESRDLYLSTTPIFQSYSSMSDSFGNISFRVRSSSGTPAVTDIVCSLDNSIDVTNTQNAQIASLMIGGFAAMAFILVITARFRGRL